MEPSAVQARRPEAPQFAASKAFTFFVLGWIVHVALTLLALAVLHSPTGWWIPTPTMALSVGVYSTIARRRSIDTGRPIFWTPMTLRFMVLFGSILAIATFTLNYLLFGRPHP